MKKKLVMKVDPRSRTEALKIAASMPGVLEAALDDRHKDRLVVVGDGVDAVELTRLLRNNIEEKDEEGGGGGSEKKDNEGGGSEKKDEEGGRRAGEKNDNANGELRKMGANKYGGWFMHGPGTCAEAVLDEPKQEEWLLTVAR